MSPTVYEKWLISYGGGAKVWGRGKSRPVKVCVCVCVCVCVFVT